MDDPFPLEAVRELAQAVANHMAELHPDPDFAADIRLRSPQERAAAERYRFGIQEIIAGYVRSPTGSMVVSILVDPSANLAYADDVGRCLHLGWRCVTLDRGEWRDFYLVQREVIDAIPGRGVTPAPKGPWN